MFSRIKLGLVAALVALTMVFTLAAQAQDKGEKTDKGEKGDKKVACVYCHTVHDVCKAMRCEQCATAEKPCEHCAKTVKAVAHSNICASCREMHKEKAGADKVAACADCAAKLKDSKPDACTFCMVKKMMVDNTYCC